MSGLDLRERIVHGLRSQDADLSAVELAVLLNQDVYSVRRELRGLVAKQRVTHIYYPSRVVRYRARTPSGNHVFKRPMRQVELLLCEIDAVAHIDDASDRLASLELLGARVAMHLQSAMTAAEAANAPNSLEAK